MTNEQLVALAASIGACMSALAGFFTVREISKQRQATYRPELVPSTTHFSAVPLRFSNSPIPDRWTRPIGLGEDDLLALEATMSIENIGLGAAKRVKVQWDFDIASAISQANEIAQKSLSAAYFELEDGILKLKSEGGKDSMSLWKNQTSQEFDYILPASGKTPSAHARIPHAYTQIVAAILYFRNKGESRSFPDDLPILDLMVSYVDIAGAQHSARYSVKTQVTMLSGKAERFDGYLESSQRI